MVPATGFIVTPIYWWAFVSLTRCQAREIAERARMGRGRLIGGRGATAPPSFIDVAQGACVQNVAISLCIGIGF